MTKIKLLLITALVTIASISQAQSNNVTGFFSSAQSYLTSFNTNFTWDSVSFEASTGFKQVYNVGAQNVLDLSYNRSRISYGASLGFSGVGTAFNVTEASLGYAVIQHYDTKVVANLAAGYDFNQKAVVIEPGLFIKKKATPNTFFEIGITLPQYVKGTPNRTPAFVAETGFTY